MTTLCSYTASGGVIISIDNTNLSPVPDNIMTFDYVGNEALVEDIMVNTDHYLLVSDTDLQKDGIPVAPSLTPAAGSWRAQRTALVADQALITAAATVADLKPILEDMRATLIAMMDILGEQW